MRFFNIDLNDASEINCVTQFKGNANVFFNKVIKSLTNMSR